MYLVLNVSIQNVLHIGTLQPHKWENAMTIDKLSWGHRGNAQLKDFLTSKELIDGKRIKYLLTLFLSYELFILEIVVTVSCGGNILVNVGPTKFGTIEAIFADRLRDMGRYCTLTGMCLVGLYLYAYF